MNSILFVHGFPFDHLLWRHQVAALSEWRCLTPDLRGAGTAEAPPSPAAYTMAEYARDLIALLDRAGVARTVVCGLSMGGYVTFELMRQAPGRIAGLVLCNTKASADSVEGKRARDAMAELALREGSSAIAQQLVPRLVSRETLERRPDVVHELRAMITRQPVPGIVGALHALRERPDSTPLLAAIRLPVLVLAGDDDRIAPAAEMAEMAEAIGGATFEIIPAAGHLAPLEQPDLLNRALREFLEKLG